VQEVAALPAEVGVTLRDPSPLLLPVIRPVLLPRERPLFAFQASTLVGKVQRPDRRPISVVGVLEYPYVDTDTLLRILGRFGWLSVHLDTEGSEPFTCRLFFERDLLNGGVVGNGPVEPNRYVTEFRE